MLPEHTSHDAKSAAFGSYEANEQYKRFANETRPPDPPRPFFMIVHQYRNWALSALLSLALFLLIWPTDLGTRANDASAIERPTDFTAAVDPPRQSTNLTNSVQWDKYSLFLEDQRIFLQ